MLNEKVVRDAAIPAAIACASDRLPWGCLK
jgi:hypothetical protein